MRLNTLILFFLMGTPVIAAVNDFKDFSKAETVMFADTSLERAVRFSLGIETGDITETDMEQLTQLFASDKNIYDLTGLEYAVNLEIIWLARNRLKSVSPLAGLDSLEYIDLIYNQLNDLSTFQYLPKLKTLYLQGNELADISELAHVQNLEHLSLFTNKISDITPLQNLVKLTYLDLGDNPVSDIQPLQNLVKMKELSFYQNPITDISALKDMVEMDRLYIYATEVEDISALENMTVMRNLKLSDNRISDISPLKNMQNIRFFQLDYNQIRDITVLAGIESMTALNIDGNHVEDISVLNSLPNLDFLALTGNKITDLSPIQNLPKLNLLQLGYLKIKDISFLKDLVCLNSLYLTGNHLDNEDLLNLYNLDSLQTLSIRDNEGIISGSVVQQLADNLDMIGCEDIMWKDQCGEDKNLAKICWLLPEDSVIIGDTVKVEATATSSINSHVQIRIDWGNENLSDYSDYQKNASTFKFSHVYLSKGSYYIRVQSKDEQGNESEWSPSHYITVYDTTINPFAVEERDNHSTKFALHQNYPNPFNPFTKINYQLEKSGNVTLQIYDVNGRAVKTLLNDFKNAGIHSVVWDGTNEQHQRVSSGIYFYDLKTEHGFQFSSKMLLMK